MNWVHEFYTKQNQWSGVYDGDPTKDHRQKARLIEELAGLGPKRILELGAGGGQLAAATADLGHTVVAVELVASACTNARKLAAADPARKMEVIEGDFFAAELEGTFDVIGYWDGFGIGADDDQRRLLKRVAGWLAPAGSVLFEIGTPWYAASVDGRGWEVGAAERRYSFDADGCRWEDTWWPQGQPEQAVRQSTRCYSPADLRLLLAGTGLHLHAVKPGGTVDWEQRKWLPAVPLGKAMSYVAHMKKVQLTKGE
ncbi:MAG: class I SAM-dependent methyltransferase [Caldilineaceae bacterium]